MKTFVFNGYLVSVDVSRPKTVWFYNFKDSEKSPAQRVDSLICLERVFIRYLGIYLYTLKIGRIHIMFTNARAGK